MRRARPCSVGALTAFYPSSRPSEGRAEDGGRISEAFRFLFVPKEKVAAVEAPTNVVVFVAAADLSSDEFLKGIYNVASSPSSSSCLFTFRAFPSGSYPSRIPSRHSYPSVSFLPFPSGARLSQSVMVRPLTFAK